MILLPKRKIIHQRKPLKFTTGVSGEFRLVLRDLNLNPVYDSGWFDNTILDGGLDVLGGGSTGIKQPFDFFAVGNDATAVNPAQTGLIGFLASSTLNVGSDVPAWVGTPNWEYSLTRTHRFAAGVATDTIREVSAGANSSNTEVYSRQLVTPEIIKGADQVLDVSYRHTHWPPLADVSQSGSLSMDGELYNTIIRGSDYDRTTQNDAMTQMAVTNSGGSNDQRIYDGNIGATVTDQPSGSSSLNWGGASDTDQPYTLTQHVRDVVFDWQLDNGNAIGDIRSMQIRFSGALIQIQFDRQSSPGSGIPKDETKVMDLTIRQAWARH